MPAGSGNFHRPLYILLPDHILKIQKRYICLFRNPNRFFFQNCLAVQCGSQFCHRMHRDDGRTSCQRCLSSIFRRDKQCLKSLPFCRNRHRQHTVYAADLSIQSYLSNKRRGRSGTANRPGCTHNAQQDGQVIMGAALFQTGRCQIHCNASGWKPHSAYLCGSTDTLPGLFYRCIRKSHNIETGQAVGDITFHRNLTALNSVNSQSMYAANHRLPPP